MHRRSFIELAAGATILPLLGGPALGQSSTRPSLRPAMPDRKFVSDRVEAKIREITSRIEDKELAWLFENCYPNTLDTTVSTSTRDGKPDTFVITGDIDALWLRDSTAQVSPYLMLAKGDA